MTTWWWISLAQDGEFLGGIAAPGDDQEAAVRAATEAGILPDVPEMEAAVWGPIPPDGKIEAFGLFLFPTREAIEAVFGAVTEMPTRD